MNWGYVTTTGMIETNDSLEACRKSKRLMESHGKVKCSAIVYKHTSDALMRCLIEEAKKYDFKS